MIKLEERFMSKPIINKKTFITVQLLYLNDDEKYVQIVFFSDLILLQITYKSVCLYVLRDLHSSVKLLVTVTKHCGELTKYQIQIDRIHFSRKF